MSEQKEKIYPLVKSYKETNDPQKKEETLKVIEDNLNSNLSVILPYKPFKLDPTYGYYYDKYIDNKKCLCVYSKSGYLEIMGEENDDVILIIEFKKLFKKIIKEGKYSSIIIDYDNNKCLEITKEEMIKILEDN